MAKVFFVPDGAGDGSRTAGCPDVSTDELWRELQDYAVYYCGVSPPEIYSTESIELEGSVPHHVLVLVDGSETNAAYPAPGYYWVSGLSPSMFELLLQGSLARVVILPALLQR